MGEFEEKLQSILGNPEAMGQIMSIAQALGGGQSQSGQEAPSATLEAGQTEPAPAVVPASSGGGDLSALLGNLDPRLLQLGMRLLSEYNAKDERKAALLNALRPFMKEERFAKVDQAMQIARMSHMIRIALDAFQKGDDSHV